MALPFHRRWNEILGMNARTLEYVRRANTEEARRLAHRKLATKRALQKAGVPTPRLFSIIRSRGELRRFVWTKLPASFVVKPNSSSGGGGILVIFGRNKKGNWVRADHTKVFIPELKSHVLDILDGNFSRGNVPDIALFEQRVKVHTDLKQYSVRGVPDIRVLVYNAVPVMAMLRLPTAESGGRANLHVGGIGVGIDLSTGATTTAIHHGRLIETLPGTRISCSGIQIPAWNETVSIAVQAAQAIGLQFAGVDVAIDRDDGPMVLEINARPGLEIQVANMAPLKSRLRRVEGLSVPTAKKGVQLAKSLFGSSHDLDTEDIDGRAILGVEEEVTIADADGHPHPILAKIDTGAYRTTVDKAIAKAYGLHRNVLEYKHVRGALGKQARPVVEMNLAIRGRRMKTTAFLADRSHMKYDMIIGRRDLQGFLVDPMKAKKKS